MQEIAQGTVTVEMDVAVALAALTPLHERWLEHSRHAALSMGEEAEIAKTSARFLQDAHDAIVNAIYPEVDQAFEDDPMPVDLNVEGDPTLNGAFR